MYADAADKARILLVVAVLAMAGKSFGAQPGWFERFFLEEAYVETQSYWRQLRLRSDDKPTQTEGNLPVVKCDDMYPNTYLR